MQFFQFNGHFTSTGQKDSPLNIYLTSNLVSTRLGAYSRSEDTRWFTFVRPGRTWALFECSTWMSMCSTYVEKVTWDIRGHEWPHDIWRLCTRGIHIFTSLLILTFFATEMIEPPLVFTSSTRNIHDRRIVIQNATNIESAINARNELKLASIVRKNARCNRIKLFKILLNFMETNL